jgi:hypothetical protein
LKNIPAEELLVTNFRFIENNMAEACGFDAIFVSKENTGDNCGEDYYVISNRGKLIVCETDINA